MPQHPECRRVEVVLGPVKLLREIHSQFSISPGSLYQLLRKDVGWKWGEAEEDAFQRSKKELLSSQVLVHYGPRRELLLACDASPYGVGAVLSQRMEDVTEHPVAFASRSLSPAEKGYSQLDRGGLAIIFGVKRFSQYLYGRSFTIQTDHQPLMGLFSTSRSIPTMASARIHHWALILACYQYRIVYRAGKTNANADGLSRLPLPGFPVSPTCSTPSEVNLLLEHLDCSSLTSAQIREWTGRDPVLAVVRRFALQGWADEIKDERIRPFANRRQEISTEGGCLLWSSRIIVPERARKKLMEELHADHPGIARI